MVPRGVALAFVAAITACGSDGSSTDAGGASVDWTVRHELPFGPFEIGAGEEDIGDCAQVTLHNDTEVFINTVELTVGPGFHHSNWFFVPETVFNGDDGIFNCDSRNFTEPAAGIFGGVLFAQSTQADHEVQQFPPGAALKIPPHSKIVAQLHLLNGGDEPVHLAPTIALTPMPPAEVTTLLAGVSFENQALAIPPHAKSRFTIECDLEPQYQHVLSREPDFHLYHALAHYHALGSGLQLEAVKPDGTSAMVFTTEGHVGDALGKAIDPPFDMTGYTKLRISCDYNSSRDTVVGWGNGDAEMCVFLAFSDSPYHWAGGDTHQEAPDDPTVDGDVMSFTAPCSVYALDASH
ncbi:hypothetical protein BH11MYX2_BH11MYX2_09790 [soil metagenome]